MTPIEILFMVLPPSDHNPRYRRILEPGSMTTRAGVPATTRTLLRCYFGAEFIKRSSQVGGNCGRVAPFNLAAFHHVDELASAKYPNRGGGRKVTCEIAAGLVGGCGILPSKHAIDLVGLYTVLESLANGGTHLPCGAAANGVDDHHGGAGLVGEGGIDRFRGAQFFNTNTREFFAHRDQHDFWIHRHNVSHLESTV